MYLNDGIHFNARGRRMLAGTLRPVIQSALASRKA